MDPNTSQKGRKRTALGIALERKNDRLIEMLFHRGARLNPDFGRGDGRASIEAAVECDRLDIAAELISQKADLRARPVSGEQTALQIALEKGQGEMVQLILENGAEEEAYTDSTTKKQLLNLESTLSVKEPPPPPPVLFLKPFIDRLQRKQMTLRRLVVCCDGTWMKNDADQPLSNVARITFCFSDDDYRQGSRHFTQLKHYQSGVGTSSNWLDDLIEGAMA